MFINIWNGIVTIYRMTISKKTSKLMHDMEYQELVSEKQEETAYGSSFEENQIIGNLIIKNVIYESTGKTLPFNDFYSEDHSIRNYHYTIYRLPKVYFVLKDLMAKHYEALYLFKNV